MITEDYVSFETAKLLQEKGFDWEWSPFYSEQDRDEWFRNNNYNVPNKNYDANIPFDSEILNVIAPHVSFQMAMKWLREVYHLHIISYPSPTHYEKTNGYCFVIYDIKNGKYGTNGCKYCYGIDTNEPTNYSYEEACEVAIKYCLEKLI
jgi:hypothetical protein